MEAVHITDGDALIVSDTHFCTGGKLPDGKPNPHELFFEDREFERMLRSWKRRSKAKKRTLVMNGDIIDFHAIPHDGSFRCVPTEEAALKELQACLDGHPVVWSSVSNFIVRSHDDEIVIVVGNHDLELAWPSVQQAILERLDPAGTCRDRIRFTRQVRYGEEVLIVHGDECDSLSRKPEEEHTFITGKVEPLPAILAAVVLLFTYSALIGVVKAVWSRSFTFSIEEIAFALIGFLALLSLVSAFIVKVFFGAIGKEKVYLNHPTSTYMNSWLGQRLRSRMPWIGRMQNHGAIWFLSLVRNWRFAFATFPAMFVYFCYHRFVVEVVDFRREHKKARFTLTETLRLLKSTMQGDQYETELDSFVKRHPKVKFFVMGHTHVPEDRLIHLGERKFRYLNSGTMIRQVRLVSPQPESDPLPWVKMFFWRIAVYWRKRPWSAVSLTLAHLVLGVLAVWLMGHLGYEVSAWIVAVIVTLSLFWRQSYAQYRGEEFTEFTPIEIRAAGDGTKKVRLMHYDPDTDTWAHYLEESTAT